MAIIYLDNNATTKPYPEVVEAMTEVMMSRYWSPSSAYGELDGVENIVESAKFAVRTLVGASSSDEVIFTSGATESNNWAVAEGGRRVVAGGAVLTSEVEHPSIASAIDDMKEHGVDVRRVRVTTDGMFDLDDLAKIVDSKLNFASLILVHNETGVIQPLKEAISLIRERAPECLIHTDATQAVGKIEINLSQNLSNVDLVSFSGHKFHGPKGIGGLIIRNNNHIRPLILGGGQQNLLRSGTLNVPAIAGLLAASKISSEMLQDGTLSRVKQLRDDLEERVSSIFPHAVFLGKRAPRIPNTTYFGIPGTDGDDLVHAFAAEGIVVSKGSSCSDQSIEPSKAAMSMGSTYDEASSLIRVSMSTLTSIEEVVQVVNKLRELVLMH